jgi:hypothetical protein
MSTVGLVGCMSGFLIEEAEVSPSAAWRPAPWQVHGFACLPRGRVAFVGFRDVLPYVLACACAQGQSVFTIVPLTSDDSATILGGE